MSKEHLIHALNLEEMAADEAGHAGEIRRLLKDL